jgi:phosphatidate cytidylyltransferase
VQKNKPQQTATDKPTARNSGATRVLTAVIALPILIATIVVPQLALLFVLLAVVAIGLAMYEYYSLALRRDIRPDIVAMYLATAALLTIAYFNDPAIDLLLTQFVLIVLTVGTLVRATLKGAPFDKMIASSGVTILGVLYVGWLGSYIVSLRTAFTPTMSRHILSFLFIVNMGSDAGAYYVGRALGKHKLAPSISPGKTWEGVFGGLAAAVTLAALSHYWFFTELPLKWGLLLAAIMTVVGILGDLTESALKRSAGAKDAAQLLPGHGGVLDRLDSLLFNAPLIYYFARFYFNR